MRKIIVGIFNQDMDPIFIHCDNQSYIKLFENTIFHDMSKHIDITYNHLRYCMKSRIMMFQYIPAKEKDVDILTKTLSRGKFEFHRCRIGVVQNPFLAKMKC